MLRTLIILTFRPLAILVACAWICPPAAAQEAAVDAAREALRNTRQPWYDVERDDVVQVEDLSSNAKPVRGDWQRARRTSWDWNWTAGGNWSWLGGFMKFLAWSILIGLLGFLIYALIQTYLNARSLPSSAALQQPSGQATRSDEERLEQLPVPLNSSGDFLAIASSRYREGHFGEAIVYLFGYRLMQLDRAGYIRLAKGKTNRQYLHELRKHADLQQILGQTILPFEDFFFGKHTLSKERFERCWNFNERFSQLVQQVRG